SGSTDNPFTWAGEIGYFRDIETGEYDVRARRYRPDEARFKSEDSLEDDMLQNLYRYVANNPVLNQDPSGNGACYGPECDGQPAEAEPPAAPVQNAPAPAKPKNPTLQEIYDRIDQRAAESARKDLAEAAKPKAVEPSCNEKDMRETRAQELASVYR